MRQNPPTLRRPRDDVRRFTERQLGVMTPRETRDQLDELKRAEPFRPDVPPVLNGSWSDGTAGINLAKILAQMGLIKNLSTD